MKVTLRGLGLPVEAFAPAKAFLREDSLWRLRTHYGPALAARTLAPSGLALDVGAGFGAFALPFARTFPGWRVLAFEPDPECFADLVRNAPDNVLPLPIAVGGSDDAPEDPEAVRACLLRGEDPTALLPRRTFYRHATDHGYMQREPLEGGLALDCPVLAADLLDVLQPNLLKLIAPQTDALILQALAHVPLDHILGESWNPLRWADACHPSLPGRRETWVPLAGPGLTGLRHVPEPSDYRPGLDVIVPMLNAQEMIIECVGGVLWGADDDTRVTVIDRGSTDQSCACIDYAFAHDPRVRLLRHDGPTLASTRNWGRLHSDRSHIAFVDPSDLPGRLLFARAFELAMQTGAEIVQAPCHLATPHETGFHETPDDQSGHDLSPEAHRHAFLEMTCHLARPTGLPALAPRIGRRVYRRDVLDRRGIWFPEHLAAHDDLAFQLMTLHQVLDLPVLEGTSYGIRARPAPPPEADVQVLEALRLALLRGLDEGWPDLADLWSCMARTITQVAGRLPPERKPGFVTAAAELWALAARALPAPGAPPVIAPRVAELEARLADLPPSAACLHLQASGTWLRAR